ncbi:MAG TPA: AMP-binding protein [Gemmatimonadaceae bacterium]|nr:AMP-binding protein [Gemmatimonadaceae bacterium]
MLLTELFDRSLIQRAGACALEWDRPGAPRVSLTFGDLEARSNRLAQLLAARGLVRGDRLAFCLANRVEIVDLWLACAKLGVIVVPVNVLYTAREIGHIVRDAEPRAVVATSARATDVPAGTACWDVDSLEAEWAPCASDRPRIALDDDAPAALVYTSGTTGASKGAVLTHGNFAANARALTGAWRITSADRYLAVLPLFHVHGLGNGVHCWLASGCHMRLIERFEHATAADLFEEYRPTLFFGVPTIYVRLLDVPAARARGIGERMRLFVSGSAPLPPQVLEAFRARYGHVILERYGMTETLMNASNPHDGERRAGTVGPPLPHVELRVLDELGAPVADGATGEVWVRGPNVCAGYWKREAETAAAFRNGWFRTGDLGARSSDGYLTLRGRVSDLIISGGFNVYPREVEELLLAQPGVREAVVIGATDPVRGEVPVAYLVSDVPLDERALREGLGAVLASFKLPRGYVRVDALPRTALGKVQKHLLPPWSPS